MAPAGVAASTATVACRRSSQGSCRVPRGMARTSRRFRSLQALLWSLAGASSRRDELMTGEHLVPGAALAQAALLLVIAVHYGGTRVVTRATASDTVAPRLTEETGRSNATKEARRDPRPAHARGTRPLVPAGNEEDLAPPALRRLERDVRRPRTSQAWRGAGRHRGRTGGPRIGCGTGNLSLAVLVAQPDARVTGLDPDGAALRRAPRKAHRRGVSLSLVQGYADRLPTEDASLDQLVSSLAPAPPRGRRPGRVRSAGPARTAARRQDHHRAGRCSSGAPRLLVAGPHPLATPTEDPSDLSALGGLLR